MATAPKAPAPPPGSFLYAPSHAAIPYGHLRYDVGWDANSRSNSRVADHSPDRASGFLVRPDGALINLWITDMQATFAVAGVAAQSRMLREWYPRSFADVTLQITGNVPNTQEYNRLAMFVREHQYLGLQYVSSGGTATQTVTFGLHDQTPSQWGSPAARGSDVVPTNGLPPSGVSTNVKGNHLPWQVNGYIQSIDAGAVRHEVAPEFTINLIVAGSTFVAGQIGIWKETVDDPSALGSFLTLINAAAKQSNTFVTNPITGVGPSNPPLPQSQATAAAGAVAATLNTGEFAAIWSTFAALGSGG